MTIRIGGGPVAPQTPQAAPRRRWPLYAAVAAVVILLAVAASVTTALIVSGRGHGTPQAQATTAAPVKLDSPQAIAQRLADLGAPCGPLEPITNPLGATARASCYVGENEVVISMYADHDSAEAQWDMQSTMFAGISHVDMVIGDQWTISADDPAYAKRAAELLGGTYRHAGA